MNLDWHLYHVVLLQMSTEQLLSSLTLHAYFIAFGYSHLISRPSFYSTASFVPYVFCHMWPCWPCCCRIMTICLCFCSLNQAKPKLHLRISKQLFMCGVVSWTFSQYANPVGIFYFLLPFFFAFTLLVAISGLTWTHTWTEVWCDWQITFLVLTRTFLLSLWPHFKQMSKENTVKWCHFISKKGKSGSNSR